MRSAGTALVGIALLAATGCGGGGGSDDPAPATPGVTSISANRAVLVIVGGSQVPTLAAGSGSQVVRDTTDLVDPGEIFIMVRDPIAGSASLDLPVAGGSVAAPLSRLNRYRASTGGTALDPIAESASLATAAIRHAGWQALDDAARGATSARLNHGEPAINALSIRDAEGSPIMVSATDGSQVFSGGVPAGDDLAIRIRVAEGGVFPGRDVLGAKFYLEDIASDHGESAIDQLWNTVYHRLPMMRHRARSAGYGDMALARSRFPASGVPADDPWGNDGGNGYATINWTEFRTPAIHLSVWPVDGQEGVPGRFSTDSESPDPASTAVGFASNRDQVGPVLHAILPTAAAFAALRVEVSLDAAPTWTLTATTAAPASEVFVTGPHRFTVGP